jgi:hypothetical protein
VTDFFSIAYSLFPVLVLSFRKTLMMDMLYDTTDVELKRRVHFHKVGVSAL